MTQLFRIIGRLTGATISVLLAAATAYGQATSQESEAKIASVVDTADLTDFFVFGEDSTTVWKYQFGKSPAGFIDYYQEELERFGGHSWHVRIRVYSTGQTERVFYRRTDEGVFHVLPYATKATPSMTMPSLGWVGRTWAEADHTWTYTIRSVDATLRTDRQEYEDLLVIRTKEQYPADGKPARIYDLYFARGIGMIATVVNVAVANEDNRPSSVALVRLVETEGL